MNVQQISASVLIVLLVISIIFLGGISWLGNDTNNKQQQHETTKNQQHVQLEEDGKEKEHKYSIQGSTIAQFIDNTYRESPSIFKLNDKTVHVYKPPSNVSSSQEVVEEVEEDDEEEENNSSIVLLDNETKFGHLKVETDYFFVYVNGLIFLELPPNIRKVVAKFDDNTLVLTTFCNDNMLTNYSFNNFFCD